MSQHNHTGYKYRSAALFLSVCMIFALFSIFSQASVSADESGNEETSWEKTQIVSVMPYVDKTENGITQTLPVTSREDIRTNANSTFLMVKIFINAQDAQTYAGNSLYIFKIKTFNEISDLSDPIPITSFMVQQSEAYEYNVKLLVDLSNLNNGEMYNKFVVATKTGEKKYVAVCGAHYIDNINYLSNKKDTPPVAISKKGLEIQMPGEAGLLGVKHTTIEMFLNDFMSANQTPNTEIYKYAGEDFYFNIDKISHYDKKIKYLTNEGIYVTAILLLTLDLDELIKPEESETGTNEVTNTETNETSEPTNNTDNADTTVPEEKSAKETSAVNPLQYLIHPNALALSNSNAGTAITPMFYGINITDEQGTKYFEALMSFIADRYVKEDVGYGRIYNIILGDEIGRSSIYNNCGQIEFTEYVKNYWRAARICDTAIRSRFGGSRVYIPFDKYFASKPESDPDYINKEIIDLLCEYSQAEGNFIWNIAFHAYNNDVSNAETWKESVPAESYDTPVITMKNINVLCDYINLVKKEYLPDGEPRKVMLSGQGYSSGDNTDEKIDAQAAAFVYAYLKARYLPDITAFIYHRHVDNSSETNSYGLWTKEADTISEPDKKKRIYDVFKYMDTSKEIETIEFAKNIFGIHEFDEMFPLYSKDADTALDIYEADSTTIKTTLTHSNIARFNNSSDMRGFIATSNATHIGVTEKESTFADSRTLLVGMNNTSSGDYSGIFRTYTPEESAALNLASKKYIGIELRVETKAVNIDTVPLLLIIEGESGGIPAGTVPVASSQENQTQELAGTAVKSSKILFEAAANIKPNEDTTVYFDLKDWQEDMQVNKIKLMINPHADNIVDSTSSNISTFTVGIDDSDTESNTAKYDFDLYVWSIMSASNAKKSVVKILLTVAGILAAIIVAGYIVLVIRAKVISHKRRKKRAEQRRRRMMMQQSQNPGQQQYPPERRQ